MLRFAFDLLPDLAAIFLALVLAAAGLALLFLPEELKRLEERRRTRVVIAALALGIGVVFGVGGVISDLVQKHEDKETTEADKREAKRERDKLVEHIGALIDQQKLAVTKEDILQAQVNRLNGSMPELLGGIKQVANPKSGPKPDVTLRFVYPKIPALLIVNQSDVVAREMKWAVVLWNADLPDRMDPLPIPTQVFDWLKPHAEGGPQSLFGVPGVKALVKSGDHLLGSAAVECPECPKGRAFFVSIVWDEGGWFSEIKDATSGSPYIPSKFTKDSREAYFKIISAIPKTARIQIGDR